MRRAARSTLFLILVAAVVCVGLVGASLAAPLRTPTNPGTTDLVAWWSLNEESGTRADNAGSNNLTDNNTVGYAAGVQGNAANFTALNNEALTIADNANLRANGSFSIGGWFYLKSSGVSQDIATKWITGTGNREYALRVTASNKLTFFASNDGTTYIQAETPALSTSTWYFAIAWFDAGTGYAHIQLDNGTTANSAGTIASILSGSNSFALSRLGSLTLDGYEDEIFIYNGRTLSADERSWLYNAGSGRRYCEVANNCPEFLTATASALTATFQANQTATAAALTATFEANQTATAAQATADYWANETATAVALTATAESWTHTPTPTATYTPTNTATATATIDLTRMAAIPTWAYGSTISYGDVATFNALACLIVVAALFAVGWLVMHLIRSRGSGG